MLVAHRYMQKTPTASSHIHYRQSMPMLARKDLGSNTLASKSNLQTPRYPTVRLSQKFHLIQHIVQIL
jgi:hypothetical protein